jgi:hypothetical protein
LIRHSWTAPAVDPPLERRDGRRLLHVYDGDELCLYYDEFDDTKHLIADVLIP